MSSNNPIEHEIVLARCQQEAFSGAKYRLGDVIDGNEITFIKATAIARDVYRIGYAWRKYDPIVSLTERSSFVFYAGSCFERLLPALGLANARQLPVTLTPNQESQDGRSKDEVFGTIHR